MEEAYNLIQWISATTAIAAAVLWFWSASISIPDMMELPLSGKGSLTDLLKKQSRISALAALCAGVAALAQTGSMLLSSAPSP